MGLDVTKVMILLQRRYSSIREIDRVTKELEEAFVRGDEVSAFMLFDMRADEMAKADDCTDAIWQLGEEDRNAYQKLRLLMLSDPEQTFGESPEEKKIYEIRRKTQETLDKLRTVDQRLNRNVTREKSYYGAEPRRRPVNI